MEQKQLYSWKLEDSAGEQPHQRHPNQRWKYSWGFLLCWEEQKLRSTQRNCYQAKDCNSPQQKCDQTRIQNTRPHIEAQSKGDRARKINLKTLTIAYDLRLLCKAMYSYNEGICFIVGTQLTWNHVSPTSYNNTSHVSYF